jgi:hypothetical protein
LESNASVNSTTRRFVIGLANPASSAKRSKLPGPTWLLQHGEVVSRADPEIASDDFPFALIGQNAREEPSAVISIEMLLGERKRL